MEMTVARCAIYIVFLVALFSGGCQRPASISEATDESEIVAREIMTAIDAQDFDRLSTLMADDFVVRFVGSPDRVGRDGTFELIRQTYTSFPDYKHVIDEIITGGDRVVVRMTYQGTHLGERDGIAPTGQQVNYDGVQILTVVDGVAQDVWILDDRLELMSQLGMQLTPIEDGLQ